MKGRTPYPFVYRYAALIVLGFPFVLLYKTLGLPNFLLSVPFFVAALFFFTIAQVMPCADHLKYRRFRRWISIPYSEAGDAERMGHSVLFGRLAICRRGVGCTSLGGKSDSAGIPTLSTQFKAKQDFK